MSIDYLLELERAVEAGQAFYACPGVGRNQWHIEKQAKDLVDRAQRSADARKCPVHIVQLLNKDDTGQNSQYLVPTKINDSPGAATHSRNGPSLQWSTVETKEAAEMARDVRFGPSPYFAIESVQEIRNKA